jgi:opacity protein-like surface antigen
MSRHMKIRALGAIVVTTMASIFAVVQPSQAADMAAPYVPNCCATQQKVEFGSGWYIRGDVGYEQTADKLNASSFVTPVPTILLDATQGHQSGYVFDAGAGYKLNDWFRFDATGDIRKDLHSLNGGAANQSCPGPFGSISCYSVAKASLTRYDVMANAYVDLGTYSSFTPYVGVGVGAAFGRVGTSANWYQSDNSAYNIYVPVLLPDGSFLYQHYFRDSSSNSTYVNFAWALMAGFAFDIADHLKLDVGYRYFNGGRLPNTSGSTSPLVANEIRVGLRYMID